MGFEAALLRSCAHCLATGAPKLEAMLVGASSEQSARSAALVGTILLLAAALGVVAQLKDAMNTIWNVPEIRRTPGFGGISAPTSFHSQEF